MQRTYVYEVTSMEKDILEFRVINCRHYRGRYL